MRFPRWTERDPLVVTLLPATPFSTQQELADAEIEREWRRRVAENERNKYAERQRKVADMRENASYRRALRYLRQAN